MKLTSIDGSELELSIKSYQYQKIKDAWDDWLNIVIKVTLSEGSWEATRPCMLTWEAQELAQWLELCATNQNSKLYKLFTEPYIRFKIITQLADYLQIRVFLENGFRPPWNPTDFVIDDDEQSYFVDLKLTSDDLKTAAESLSSQLESFPVRMGIRSWNKN